MRTKDLHVKDLCQVTGRNVGEVYNIIINHPGSTVKAISAKVEKKIYTIQTLPKTNQTLVLGL